MALTPSWPGVTGLATTTDGRKALSGLLVKTTAGVPRSGVFPRHANDLVTARADMNLDIGIFEAAAVQFGGTILLTNDAVAQLPSVLVSPGAGTNYYVVYAKQNESAAPGTDANNNRVFGAQLSTTSFAVARAAMPAGAVELATVQMPTGKTATNQGGVVITQTFQYTTTSGGVLWFRTIGERDAATGFADGQQATVFGDPRLFRSAAGVWKNVNTGLNLIKPPSVTAGTISGEGLVTFAGVTSGAPLIIDGVFTGDYDHYRIKIDITAASAAANIAMRVRSSGATDSAANYHYELLFGSNATDAAAGAGSVTAWLLSAALGVYHATNIELHNPASASIRTQGTVDDGSDDGVTHGRSAAEIWHGNATAHDGLVIYPSTAANFSGKVRVYGYYNG